MKHIKPGRGRQPWSPRLRHRCGLRHLLDRIRRLHGAPISFSIFGVLFVIVGIVQAVYNFKNAAGKKRYSAFDIVDGEEEPDPLNQRFGGQPPGGRGHVRTGGAPALLPLLRRQAGGFLYILRPLRQAAA